MAKSKTKNIESHFLTFDPSDYTEIDQYSFNPVFQSDQTRALLPLANKALIFFTRVDSEYQEDRNKRCSYISAKEKRKLDKAGEVPFPFFSMVPFQAFKCEKADFENAVTFCIQNIEITGEERTGFNDTDILDATLRNDIFESRGPFKIEGKEYDRPYLLAALALWKIDQAIMAILNNKASEVASFIVDANTALDIADECYQLHVNYLLGEKEKSERQSNAGTESHKKLNPIKDKVLRIYEDRGKIQKWRSVRAASHEIYDHLDIIEQSLFVSPEGAQKTISCWISDFDTDGEYSAYKKKKVPVSRST